MIWFEHILLHDLSAKGLGTSSENLERLASPMQHNIYTAKWTKCKGHKINILYFISHVIQFIMLK